MSMTEWQLTSPRANVGLLPHIFRTDDPRHPREQVADRYAHGGGWSPIRGFGLVPQGQTMSLRYPGDPPYRELARCRLGDRTLVLFQGEFVAVVEADGTTFEVVRMD